MQGPWQELDETCAATHLQLLLEDRVVRDGKQRCNVHNCVEPKKKLPFALADKESGLAQGSSSVTVTMMWARKRAARSYLPRPHSTHPKVKEEGARHGEL
jgi:hypothetical protein